MAGMVQLTSRFSGETLDVFATMTIVSSTAFRVSYEFTLPPGIKVTNPKHLKGAFVVVPDANPDVASINIDLRGMNSTHKKLAESKQLRVSFVYAVDGNATTDSVTTTLAELLMGAKP